MSYLTKTGYLKSKNIIDYLKHFFYFFLEILNSLLQKIPFNCGEGYHHKMKKCYFINSKPTLFWVSELEPKPEKFRVQQHNLDLNYKILVLQPEILKETF
jgi:hypothetical protein